MQLVVAATSQNGLYKKHMFCRKNINKIKMRKIAVPDPPLGRIKYSVSAHVQTKLEQGLDVRREHECIKNSLTKVKLPNVLRLLDNKSGIT
jgi:hypothetical protein